MAGAQAGSDPETTRSVRRRLGMPARLLLPPLVVFVLVRLLLCLAAARSGSPAWAAGSWAHWDSALYLDIAGNGYALVRCGPEYPPGSWCGNAGWFPAYPALIRLVALLGLPLVTAAAVVSAAAALALLLVLWTRFLHARLAPGPLLLLLLAAVFPGAVYQHAVFPLALFVFAVLVHLDALQRRRWWLAGLAAALAASTYPLGVVLPLTGFVGAAVVAGGTAPARLRAAATVGGLAAAGALAVALRLQLSTGRWDAYLLVQDKYGHGLNPPWQTLQATLRPLADTEGFTAETAARWQTLFVAVVVAIALAGTTAALLRGGGPRGARRCAGTGGGATGDGTIADGPARAALPVALFVGAAWLMPLVVGSGVSLYRSEAALLPAVALLRLLPRDVAAVLLALALPLAYVMAQLFFTGRLM